MEYPARVVCYASGQVIDISGLRLSQEIRYKYAPLFAGQKMSSISYISVELSIL